MIHSLVHSFSFIPAVAAAGGAVTYWVLGFLAEIDIIPDLSILDKVGGGLTIGAILFFILRWALRRNDALTDKIHALHEERNKMTEDHFREIKEILKSKT